MWTLFLWMFSCLVFLDAAHLRQDRAYKETDPVCPLMPCYEDFREKGFYEIKPITPERVHGCSGATVQLQQCVQDMFQNEVDAICQDCSDQQIKAGLKINGTSLQVLEHECPQLCDRNGENEQCSDLCMDITRDMFKGRLQAQDMPQVLACEECQQQMLSRCPNSNYKDPWQPAILARAVLIVNGCQVPSRLPGRCDSMKFWGQDACLKGLHQNVTQFLACIDQDIEELPQCDGLKALHQIEVNAAKTEAAYHCRWIEAVHNFKREKCHA